MSPVSQTSLEVEDQLQAVIIADSFDYRLRPSTFDLPRCLIPLANIPLIEYTLTFLAAANVSEVYIIARWKSETVFEYINTSKWSKTTSPFYVKMIVSPNSYSVADIMRELDSKQIIKSDFFLIQGDVVSNLCLEDIVKAHQIAKSKDKNAIMTLTLREARQFHQSRSAADAAVFVLDKITQRCLYYQPINVDQAPISHLNLNTDLLSSSSEVEIRNDLIDCHIDICSPDCLALFSENFDYQDLRRDFVHGIITSDILQSSIYCHLVKDGYANRISDLQTYAAVSRDIVARYVYPYVPEKNSYKYQLKFFRNNIYKGMNVMEGNSCCLKQNLIIGQGTSIDSGSILIDSVIGENCVIGKNCVIERAIIWNNVHIGNNSNLKDCLVCSNVNIGSSTQIIDGSVLGDSTAIGPNSIIAEASRISRHNPSQFHKKQSTETIENHEEFEEEIVGVNGVGYLMRKIDITDSFSDEDDTISDRLQVFGILSNCKDLVALDDFDDSESDGNSVSDDCYQSTISRARSDSIITTGSEDGRDSCSLIYEAMQSLKRAHEENHKIENAILELNTLRLAENLSHREIRAAIIKFLIYTANDSVTTANKSVMSATSDVLKKWSPLLSKAVFSINDEAECILLLQRICAKNTTLSKYFLLFLQSLYNFDIINEDSFLIWFKSSGSKNGSESHVKLRTEKGMEFVRWLKEAEEESSSSTE